MSESFRVLLVEDDPGLAAAIIRSLERDSWLVDHAACIGEAFEAIMLRPYRTIILDRRLPDGEGLSLIAAAKSRSPAPQVIVLTARDEVSDRVEGLDAGADDYLIKPFSFDELLARLRAARRRPSGETHAPPIQVGSLSFDPLTRDARVRTQVLALSGRELMLLELLMRRANRVVQRSYLESEIYGSEEVSANALEQLVSRLRSRLDRVHSGAEVKVIRGLGYIIRACSTC